MPKSHKVELTKKPAKNITSDVLSTSAKPKKQQAAKFLARVPEEFIFWSHDGCVFRDLKDLNEALASMSEENFCYHSNAAKNDFSCWIRDIIGDEELAKSLKTASGKEQAAGIVAERYTFLSIQIK
jgi:hypothetical protein